MTAGARVRAPELRGAGGWLNTGGRDLTLADLRGKVVLLDFWTFCCINCLHVLDELRPLEAKYADELVVVGVHSPKFAHEADHAALAAAVERYEVHHPVLDDPELVTWDNYAARAWPTLALIDPEGYVVWSMAGEGHAEAIDRRVAELVAEHAGRGTLRRGDAPYVPPPVSASPLRFPGKVIALPSGNLLVTDSAHHSVVELGPDGESVVRRIGSGERGRDDGPGAARFAEPQGLCMLPAALAAVVGYDVVVADTANHLLRGLRLADGTVRTVAGTGRPWRSAPTIDKPTIDKPGSDKPGSDADTVDLSSPWDVAWYGDEHDGRLVVAMAGVHQLWTVDPVAGTARPWAGTTTESLRDGPVADAWMAQPSGLAADGDRLWVVDAESSALRWVDGGIENGELHTAVGQGLFDFGYVDGPAAGALLQHPLGVAVLPDRSVAVCDTYNGAIRRYDPDAADVSTLATDLAEPSGAVVADGQLVVVESAAHRLVRPVSPGQMRRLTGEAAGGRQQVRRRRTELAAGAVRLEVPFTPAPGQHLDGRDGPPVRLQVSAQPPELLTGGAGDGTELARDLHLADGMTGVLQVVAQAASCDDAGENPACHLTRQDWGVPVTVTPAGERTLRLVLRG
jgi:thiol-disulfide isomerase/thioredoxin